VKWVNRNRIIVVGDTIRYKPTGHIDKVAAIYAGSTTGRFSLVGGEMNQARAILVLEKDSGHYPVGDDIEVLLPDGVDEEGCYPVGGKGRIVDELSSLVDRIKSKPWVTEGNPDIVKGLKLIFGAVEPQSDWGKFMSQMFLDSLVFDEEEDHEEYFIEIRLTQKE